MDLLERVKKKRGAEEVLGITFTTKENKNIYQRTRESLDLPREEASDLLVTMSPERIEKIAMKCC